MQPQKKQPNLIQAPRQKKKCTCGALDSPKTKLPAGTRRLKIQPKFVSRSATDVYVPLIMLTGQWLRKTGFECDSHVIIVEEKERLIISLEKV